MTIDVKFNETDMSFAMTMDANEAFAVDIGEIIAIQPRPYTGDYDVIPTKETQILMTTGLSMARNVVVQPIPQNYGLITYNGYELTVS